MTVQKAIEKIKWTMQSKSHNKEFCEYCIQALEEVEQYRALEEKLNGISIEHIVNAFIERVEKDTNEGYEKGRILTNAEADMWEQYRALGTVEELKEAREKQISKKAKVEQYFYGVYYRCPICDRVLHDNKNHCGNCGQKIDWEEGGTSD